MIPIDAYILLCAYNIVSIANNINYDCLLIHPWEIRSDQKEVDYRRLLMQSHSPLHSLVKLSSPSLDGMS